MVIFEGKVSDWSEHAPMLMNEEANALADELAIEQARKIGLSEEEIAKYLRGSEIPISAEYVSCVDVTGLSENLEQLTKCLFGLREKLGVIDWGPISRYAREKLTQEAGNEFLLCCLLDYQSKADAAWKRASSFFRSQSEENRRELWKMIASMPEKEWRSEDNFKRCNLHWMRPAHNRLWRISQCICMFFDGDARNIWKGESVFDVMCRLYYIGAGEQIARMIVGALKDCKYLTGRGDVKADVHICRVLGRASRGEALSPISVLALSRKMYPQDPWLLDWPLWELGRSKCDAKSPNCKTCEISRVCRYAIEHPVHLKSLPDPA